MQLSLYWPVQELGCSSSRALSFFLHLYEDAVTFCNFNKYMTGYADTDLFGPSNELTRAEFVTVLHRIVDPEAAGVDFTTAKNETGFAERGL